MRIKLFLAASAALALALPVLAQQQGPAPANPAQQAPVTQPVPSTGGADETAVEVVDQLGPLPLQPPAPPVEYPDWARRDPRAVGPLDPTDAGLGDNPWGGASGAFLSVLMRRMDTPIASRWAHIALRNALLARAPTPVQVHPVDWVAERAWLLLRMGEADGAQMLVASVDTDRFTPKMVQVGVQTALATADPTALCPLEPGIRKYDQAIRALVQAMCSSLAGEPETASAQIADARRHGRIGGIDLALAQKVVGAGGSGQAATIEWGPVDMLTAWRFGLSAGTGMVPPDRLLNAAPAQLRAFLARAPLLTPQQRLDSAYIAAGLGVFSSQTMVDLYSAIYDSTDPGDLPDSDAWQLRQAFVGKNRDIRLAAIRRLLALGKDPLRKEAARAAVARAASLIAPDAGLAKDAPELISAMLAAGYDQAAARWIPAVGQMDDENADRCWAMLALAAPRTADVGSGRIGAFIRRDKGKDRIRSAFLVAGLAGLGRISVDEANSLNRRYDLGLGRNSPWTRMIDAAAARGQAGTVLVLTGTGFQTASIDQLPPAHLYRAIGALRRTGEDFTARMIAAEALSRT